MNLPNPNSEKYLRQSPFPYLVIDNVFKKYELDEVLLHWPKMDIVYWEGHKLRAGSTDENTFGKCISDFVKINFQSQKFIFFLEKLTGIKGLVLDCREIGLHETFPGGNLVPHLDYTINEITGLQHRVNAILYLNENWKNEYNGSLELYENEKSMVAIEPVFNRVAIFNIEENSWHGHPGKLNCPEGMSRKSIALNYFTVPQNGAIDKKTTLAKKRDVKYYAKLLTPPLIWKLIR